MWPKKPLGTSIRCSPPSRRSSRRIRVSPVVALDAGSPQRCVQFYRTDPADPTRSVRSSLPAASETPSAAPTARNAAPVPTETRKQPASPGYDPTSRTRMLRASRVSRTSRARSGGPQRTRRKFASEGNTSKPPRPARPPTGAGVPRGSPPAVRLPFGLQGRPAGDHRGMAEVVGELHLDQLRHQARIGEQIPQPHPRQRPGLGERPEQDQMGIAGEQRPVIVAAELAVGVVQEERRPEPLQEALHPLHGQGVAGGIVRRAEEQRPARIALDLLLQLVHRQPQSGRGGRNRGTPAAFTTKPR